MLCLHAHGALAQEADQAPGLMPPTDTLLPPVGIDTSRPGFIDTLRDDLAAQSGLAPSAVAAGPGFQIHPQVTVSEQYTQNVNQISGFGGLAVNSNNNTNPGGDFVTLIQPDLLVTENSQVLTGNLHYLPTVEIFARHGNDDGVRQQFDGNGAVTVLPGWFFIDGRAQYSEQSVFGGLGAQSQTPLPENDRETFGSASITPYFARTFGELGTAQLGGSYIYSGVNAPNGIATQQYNSLGFAVPTNYGSSWLSTERGFANFATGTIFERVQNQVGVDANFYNGSGELAGAHRVLVTDDASYAVNRFVSLIGQIGFEDMDYPQALYGYTGGVYAGGLTLTPGKNANLTVEYRRSDGFGSLFGHGNWQITPRLRLFGTYSEGIANFNQNQQNNLLYGDTDATGAYASALLAAPLTPASQYGAANQSLQHTRQLNVSLSYVQDRDVVTVAYNQTSSQVIGSPLGIPQSVLARYGLQGYTLAQILALPPQILEELFFFGFSPSLIRQAEQVTTGTGHNYFANATWNHDLQPTLASNITLGYARTSAALTTVTNTGSVLVGAGLTKSFTDTLTGSVRYAGNFQIGGGTGFDGYRNNNSFTISLTKKF